jgi:hypothetical protein
MNGFKRSTLVAIGTALVTATTVYAQTIAGTVKDGDRSCDARRHG